MHAQTRIVLLTAALALGACTVYRPDVRQGNYVDPVKFGQVKPGMTREQVRFLLGPPMIADGFHRAQWDYFFWLETQYIKAGQVKRHLVVTFDGDVVSKVENPDQPAAKAGGTTEAVDDKRVEKLFADPAAAPAAKPVEVPVEKPAPSPVENPVEKPVDAPVTPPSDVPATPPSTAPVGQG